MKNKLFVLLSCIFLSGCSVPVIGGDCPPNTIIEWIDVMQINDIQYAAMEPGSFQFQEEDKGKSLGKVKYRMAEHACTDHKMQNGDAAYLVPGSEIFEYKGYKTDFRVIAANTVYQVEENDKAETIGDLYDIEGKVTGMSLRSAYDGSHVMDLKDKHWKPFIETYLSLKYVGFDAIYKKIENEDSLFLDIHLQDGSSIRFNYWTEANAVNPGAFGNEKMLKIIAGYK